MTDKRDALVKKAVQEALQILREEDGREVMGTIDEASKVLTAALSAIEPSPEPSDSAEEVARKLMDRMCDDHDPAAAGERGSIPLLSQALTDFVAGAVRKRDAAVVRWRAMDAEQHETALAALDMECESEDLTDAYQTAHSVLLSALSPTGDKP